MNWWLVYHSEDALRNKEYIRMYFDKCREKGIKLSLVIAEQFRFLITNDKNEFFCNGESLPFPDAVINRTRDYVFARQLELLGVKVYNNSFVTLLGNDKLLAIEYVKQLGIDVMPTCDGACVMQEYPYIMKTADGHGGTEVFMINNEREDRMQREKLGGRKILLQKPASDLGRDLRVYIVGNRIVAAMLRTSDKDFRSNFCLGGKAMPYRLSGAETDIVKKITDSMEIGHCGIDFIFHNNRIVFNELEDVVGSRMLYGQTDVDVVSLYVDYIYGDIR